MLSRFRLTYSNVMSTVAVFFALGGSVYAAAKINGRQIKPNSIPGNRLKKGSVPSDRLKTGSVTGKQVNSATLGTVPHARTADNAGQLGGLPPSAFGVRAYGHVSASGALSNSKNVVGVTKVGTGSYCLSLATGINPSTAAIVVTPDIGNDDTIAGGGVTVHAEAATNAGGCSGVDVVTLKVDTSNTTSGSDPDPTYTTPNTDEPFFFVVP